MSARFVVLVEGGTARLQNMTTQRMQAAGFGFWKWMDNAWLVVHPQDNVSAKDFGEWLEQSPRFKTLVYLVLRVDDGSGDFWGRAETAESWPWMYTSWKNSTNSP